MFGTPSVNSITNLTISSPDLKLFFATCKPASILVLAPVVSIESMACAISVAEFVGFNINCASSIVPSLDESLFVEKLTTPIVVLFCSLNILLTSCLAAENTAVFLVCPSSNLLSAMLFELSITKNISAGIAFLSFRFSISI